MAGAALGHHQRPDRLHRPVTALRRPRCPAGLGGTRRADRIQRVGLALPVPVLAVRAIDFDHPHAGRRRVAGQARPVAAGPFDTDQRECPEPTQPAQQAGVSGRVTGNSCTPRSPPIGSSAAATCRSAWVSTPPVMTRASSTMVIAVPFRVEGWRAPAGRRTREPRPLPRPGRSDRQRRWVPELGPGRQAGNRTTSTASAGSQVRPGPRLRRYAQTAAKPRKQDSCRSFSDPPCRYGRIGGGLAGRARRSRMVILSSRRRSGT